MPEIDFRNSPWAQGYPREEQHIARELYRLLTIFASSASLVGRRQHDHCVYGWSIASFEYAEIGRLLVSLAAMLRNDWDATPLRIAENLKSAGKTGPVGTLIPNLAKPAAIDLTLRESLNKILHAHAINLERSEGPRVTSGHLLPTVHLYGQKGQHEWKASLDVYLWAESVHDMQ
jgi:hypothetical protein